jgi:hypothetical protein
MGKSVLRIKGAADGVILLQFLFSSMITKTVLMGGAVAEEVCAQPTNPVENNPPTAISNSNHETPLCRCMPDAHAGVHGVFPFNPHFKLLYIRLPAEPSGCKEIRRTADKLNAASAGLEREEPCRIDNAFPVHCRRRRSHSTAAVTVFDVAAPMVMLTGTAFPVAAPSGTWAFTT